MDRQRATSASEAVAARVLFAGWMRAGRQARGMTLAQVAKTTKIQTRTLEHLESGRFDQLPADVFVRDRLAGTTERVSVTAKGREGNNHSGITSEKVDLSDDGRFVAFD